jgi:hypothetical protein
MMKMVVVAQSCRTPESWKKNRLPADADRTIRDFGEQWITYPDNAG